MVLNKKCRPGRLPIGRRLSTCPTSRNRRGRQRNKDLVVQTCQQAAGYTSNDAIDTHLAAAGASSPEARQIYLSVGDRDIAVLGKVVAGITGGVLLIVVKLRSDVVGVVRPQSARLR